MQKIQVKNRKLNTIIDPTLLGTILLLMAIGLIAQFSVSSELVLHAPYDYISLFDVHLYVTLAGALSLACVVFASFSESMVKRVASVSIFIVTGLLAFSIYFGPPLYNTIYPFIVLFIGLFLCHYISVNEVPQSIFAKQSWVLFIYTLVIYGVLILQGDLFNTLLVFVLMISLTFVAKWYKTSVLLVGLSVLATSPIFLSSYYLSRITNSLNPWYDEFGNTYQLSQSFIAFSGGELFGVGFGASIIKEQLPNAHEAFVLSVLSEEFGVLFVIAIVIICSFLTYQFLSIYRNLKLLNLNFEAMLCFALNTMFTIYWTLNICIISGLFPTRNLPFPLLSYSPSSTLFFALVFALVVHLNKQARHMLQKRPDYSKEIPNKRPFYKESSLYILALITFMLSGRLLSLALADGKASEKYAMYTYAQTKNDDNTREFRGQIFDRNGSLMAFNQDKVNIAVDTARINLNHEFMHVLRLLELETGRTAQSLLAYKAQGSRFRYLKRNVDIDLANRIKRFNIPHLLYQPSSIRIYPFAEATAPLLGLTDIDNLGIDGIEKAYHEQLEKQDIQLTIDSHLQTKIFELLRSSLADVGSEDSSMTLVDAKSGEILAMANYPSFDPVERHRLEMANVKNDPLIERFKLGTLINPFVDIAASDGAILSHDNSLEPQVEGDTSAISLLSPKRLHKVLTFVGFGQKVSVAPRVELNSVILAPSQWSSDFLTSAIIGSSISATPVQILRAYLPLFNNGRIEEISLVQKNVKAPSTSSVSLIVSSNIIDGTFARINIIDDAGSDYWISESLATVPNIDHKKGLSSIYIGSVESGGIGLGIITTLSINNDQQDGEQRVKEISEQAINLSLKILSKTNSRDPK